jgi:uncharacterized protein YegL
MIELNFTAIALVVDRSGSMYQVAEDTKGSIENLIETQKKVEEKASLTLAQFNHQYEVIHDFTDLKQVDAKAFTKQYQPRGATALVDAIGRTIITMSEKIEKMGDSEKPTKVIVAIVTDGLENASHEFTIEKVKKLVEEKQTLGWDFIFLGADLNTIQTAQSYGFSPQGSAYYENANISEAMKVVGTQITNVRKGKPVEISEKERGDLTNLIHE